MSDEKNICIVCAWREQCQKRFSLPAGAKCLDFVKDVSIKSQDQEEKKETKEEKK
jgi:hypothetical protein